MCLGDSDKTVFFYKSLQRRVCVYRGVVGLIENDGEGKKARERKTTNKQTDGSLLSSRRGADTPHSIRPEWRFIILPPTALLQRQASIAPLAPSKLTVTLPTYRNPNKSTVPPLKSTVTPSPPRPASSLGGAEVAAASVLVQRLLRLVLLASSSGRAAAAVSASASLDRARVADAHRRPRHGRRQGGAEVARRRALLLVVLRLVVLLLLLLVEVAALGELARRAAPVAPEENRYECRVSRTIRIENEVT